MSLSAMFLCRLVFNKSESSLPLWRTFVHEYNSFNNCDLPVPLSPTMTLIVGRKLNSYLLLNGPKLETDSFSMACVLMRKLYVPVSDKWSSAYGCSFCMATIWLRAVSSFTLDSLVLQFGRFGRLTARESKRDRMEFLRRPDMSAPNRRTRDETGIGPSPHRQATDQQLSSRQKTAEYQ